MKKGCLCTAGASLLLFAAAFTSVNAQTPTDSLPHPADLKPGWWLLPRTDIRMTVGGYVKFDLIHDLSPIGSPNFFDVSKIPTDGSTGTSTHLQALESRIWLDVRRDSRFGEVRGYVEGDFYGSGNAFRMRHAYVTIGKRWLAGHTWSTFMDASILPPTLDYEKPAAYAFARHGLLAYTQPLLGDRLGLTLAVEEPVINVQAPGPGQLSSPLPDAVFRARFSDKWGHVQLSGGAGITRFEPDAGEVQDVNIYSVNLSGQFNFARKDKFIYQALYGPGIARYRFGKFAAPDADGKLQPITGYGFTAGILHYWSTEWSSFVMYNFGHEDAEEGQPLTDAMDAGYSAVNLLWHFTPYAFVGVEYLHGMREDISEEDGTADRIMLSVKMNLN
jgi:hypothetical protein